MFDRFPAALHPVDNRLEGGIIDQHAIFGVVDDIFELIVKQARVHRVEHPAHPGHAIPAHQMARMVHREAGNLVAFLEAEREQRLRHLERIAANARPVGAGFRAIGPAADDFALGRFARGMIDHRRDPHREILHRSKPLLGHIFLP